MLLGQQRFKVVQYFKSTHTPECQFCMQIKLPDKTKYLSTASAASLVYVDHEGHTILEKGHRRLTYACKTHILTLGAEGMLVI